MDLFPLEPDVLWLTYIWPGHVTCTSIRLILLHVFAESQRHDSTGNIEVGIRMHFNASYDNDNAKQASMDKKHRVSNAGKR